MLTRLFPRHFVDLSIPGRRLAALGLLLFLVIPVKAQELEPRAYSPAPKGLNFLVLAYGYQSGQVLFDPTVPITDVKATLSSSAIGYGRTFAIGGRSANFTAILPYVWGKVSGNVLEQRQTITRSGLADSRYKMAVNILGGPAMTPREFAARKPATTLGASLTVVAPTGQYDPARLITLGANRWAFKPELGLSHPIGHWFVEFYGGVWFFSANNNFFGGQHKEQKPIGSLQSHVSYNFTRRIWVAGDYTFFFGGRTIVNDVINATRQNNSRIGVTASFPLTKQVSLKTSWARGVVTRIGGDFNTVGIALQYAWLD